MKQKRTLGSVDTIFFIKILKSTFSVRLLEAVFKTQMQLRHRVRLGDYYY